MRTELLHNIDPIWNMSAIRYYDYKLVKTTGPVNSSGIAWRDSYDYVDFTDIRLTPEDYKSLQTADRMHSPVYRVLSQMNRRPDYRVLQVGMKVDVYVV